MAVQAKAKPSREVLRRVPKVLLHAHLDGGLRPATVIELAREAGYRELPTTDPEELAKWFHEGANRGSLKEFLRGFRHTIAVMQTPEALERVAYEFLEDQHRDGVVYAEVRFAPCFHGERGLDPGDVVRAVLRGLEQGKREFGTGWGLILCAMRDRTDSLEWAHLAVALRDEGVVGFDLAGEEAGFPPKRHSEAFHYVQRANFNITIHAGEGFGPESIWQALQYCGAHRIGHGVRLAEDLAVGPDGSARLGPLSHYVLDKRVPLEICLSSNVHTGAVRSLEAHPFPLLYRAQFRVTLNTDNPLLSATTLTEEFARAVEVYGLRLEDVERLTINAMKSAFIHYDARCRYIFDVLKPGFARERGAEK
jgi:adenosine deaminase